MHYQGPNIANASHAIAALASLQTASLLATINKYALFACQLDVRTAFLNEVLEEKIYMEILDSLELDVHTKETKLRNLERALYGLKISPKK